MVRLGRGRILLAEEDPFWMALWFRPRFFLLYRLFDTLYGFSVKLQIDWSSIEGLVVAISMLWYGVIYNTMSILAC